MPKKKLKTQSSKFKSKAVKKSVKLKPAKKVEKPKVVKSKKEEKPETVQSDTQGGKSLIVNGKPEKTEYGLIGGRSLVTEMRSSYLDYAMSVIVSRALPDVRDGLKPVHRRILYSMWSLGLRPGAKFRKSATVVGEVLGKYHPHGDTAVYDAMVRMAQDFSMRYPLVNGQGNFGCFSADTKVKLTDGRDLSFLELLEEHNTGKTNYTFTVNKEGHIEIAEIKKPRLTKKNAKIMEVCLDNGEKIRCTLNHKFMLKDRVYKEAKDLKAGDSLMPGYFRLSTKKDYPDVKSYSMIFQPKDDGWQFIHILSDDWNISRGKYPISDGRIRHHLDFNKLNNNPDNIKRMNWPEHWKIHYDYTSKKHQNDPEYRRKLAAGRKKFWSKLENREAYSKRLTERNLKNWKNQAYREKMRAFLSDVNKEYFCNHPEAIERLRKQGSKTFKRLWQLPEYRELFHSKIVSANKRRITNNTGKKKFLNICSKLLIQGKDINKENYEMLKAKDWGKKSYTSWDLGISKYYNNDINNVLYELNKNHKVLKINFLNEYTDVYDLTIDKTHNFLLSAGVFVHNSMDGDGAAAMRYCITGDSLVLTNKGIIPIEKISEKKEDKINLEILNYQGKIKKASKFFNSGKHNIIKLITKQGYEISGSYNHPLLVWQINEFGQPDFRWKLLEDITKDDHLIINRNFSLFSKNDSDLKKYYLKVNQRYKDISLPRKMNKNLAFLLGALTSEGSFHRGQILFNNQDLEFYNKVKSIIKQQFKGIKLYEREIRGNCKELSIYHQKVVRFLGNIGLSFDKSDKKEIPFSVLLSSEGSIRQFLVGLFEGDGSVLYKQDKRHKGKSIELTYNSKSSRLIKQLKIVLLNFGITTTLPYKDKRNNCLKLIISGVESIDNFYKRVGFFSKRKNSILANIEKLNPERMSKNDWIPYLNKYLRENYNNSFIKRYNFDRYYNLEKNYKELTKILNKRDIKMIDWLIKNRFFFNKVQNVEKLKIKEIVYSIKVGSNCHSFIANGFINHNTEAKLASISEELLLDLEKNTVDFVPNYDGSQKEPVVLPARLPNMLLNGALGIAVGMATNIPPHNLTELAQSIKHLIDHPDATAEDLTEFVKGPDFPTGGIIYDINEIKRAYATGKGSIVIRAKADITENKSGMMKIIVTEIPYQVNKAELVEKIADLVRLKKIEGIKDLRDESDREGVRIVIDLKKDTYPRKILNSLFKHTQLQTTFHVNLIALVDGIQPKLLNLKMVLEEYLKHRAEVLKRRTQFDLDKAKERAHILEGLTIALRNIDAVIKVIKASKDKDVAKVNLRKRFKLTEIQAVAILEMRLQNLANLERQKIKDELEEKRKLIKELESILKSKQKILGIIKKDLQYLIDKFGDERKTKVIASSVKEFRQEDLVPNEPAVIIMTRDGYIKRVPPETFKVQGRGGKGVMGLTTKEEDIVEFFFTTMTHSDILFFTTKGRVFQLKAYDVPTASRTAKGQAIVNFLQLLSTEKITTILPLDKIAKSGVRYLFMATEKGLVKKVELKAFSNVRRSGLIAIKVKEDDKLIWTKPTSGKDQIMLITAQGQSVRFKETDVRSMGRNASGVHGIRLKKKDPSHKGGASDTVVGMGVIKGNRDMKLYKVVTVSQLGYGKQSALSLYKVQSRAGSGIITFKVSAKTGQLVNAYIINSETMKEKDLIVISEKGQVIRLPFKSVPTLGRATQGVRLMRFKEGGPAPASSDVKASTDVEAVVDKSEVKKATADKDKIANVTWV